MPHRLGRSIKITAVGAAAQNLSSPVSTKQTPPLLYTSMLRRTGTVEKSPTYVTTATTSTKQTPTLQIMLMQLKLKTPFYDPTSLRWWLTVAPKFATFKLNHIFAVVCIAYVFTLMCPLFWWVDVPQCESCTTKRVASRFRIFMEPFNPFPMCSNIKSFLWQHKKK